jgi:hypothetical protein
MATQFVTIHGERSPVARCSKCGVQRQFHGMSATPINTWDRPRDHAFVAETADDLDPADMHTADLIRECDHAEQRRQRIENIIADPSPEEQNEANALYARVEACRVELKARIKATFGVSFDDLSVTMGAA